MVTERRGEREAESATVRYERVKDIVRLAVQLQAAAGGLTLEDIQADFSVSRSTAERMRDAVEEVFGRLERVDAGDPLRHWRPRSHAVRPLPDRPRVWQCYNTPGRVLRFARKEEQPGQAGNSKGRVTDPVRIDTIDAELSGGHHL